MERTLQRTVKVDQTRRPRVGPPDALINLIINLVSLGKPMLTGRNIPARHEEGAGLPESAVGLLVNVDGGNVGIGLEVVDEELALAVDALVGAGVEDGGGHADLDSHDSVTLIWDPIGEPWWEQIPLDENRSSHPSWA